ncbi:OmpA family protein [Flavobacterium sp.]|uniref:OmpA family protein n=1 Tax=Flavobacterium sp. TaxID=239 RepID=UPI0028BD83BD|nr:OmpA family protein [Flavobacterium sp.]
MKKIILTAGLFLALYGNAQTSNSQKADVYFENAQYTSAIEEYLKLAKNKAADTQTYKKLADSYYAIFNMDEAASWYGKAISQQQDAETYYKYAMALRSQGKYAESNKQMDTFSSLMPNDQRALSHKANPNYIPVLNNQNKLFDATALSVNDKDKSDFGAVLANDETLYFVSTRGVSSKDNYGQAYIDIFTAQRNADGTFAEPTALSELNSRFHDGPVSLSADGSTMYFARDGHTAKSYASTSKVKLGQVGLYKAVKVNGKWQQITALPFNSTEYSVGSPSVSEDGKTLYFASNMPGGLGDTDIWKVSINTDGSYGSPVNLGATVNTPGKENFPFITADNVLYFSSFAREGFGGFDVFKADLGKGTKAENVGKPVNSEKDDFAFSFNTKANVGYFSSNRSGYDDIYTAIPVCHLEALASVTDSKTGSPLAEVTVKVLDAKLNVITSSVTSSNGTATHNLDCETVYSLEVSKTGYETEVVSIPATTERSMTLPVALKPVNVLIKETHIDLAEINFAYDKSEITKQGAQELDKLVAIMNEYPNMVIHVKAHTDTKGSATYNLRLSEKRAQATVFYVVSKGISKARISGKGFGESEPKVSCGENCTDEQNAINRRSEFLIVKK